MIPGNSEAERKGRLATDLWDELRKLLGTEDVEEGAYDPAGRGQLSQADEVGYPTTAIFVNGKVYAVGQGRYGALSAALTRAMTELSRG
jgi:hypothetical protein